MKMIRVRFAPSPTGYIHMGNARTALFNYLYARKQSGRFILRIEDTDKERSREEYVKAIYEDLRWLGIEWQEGPDVGGNFGPYRQMERLAIYRSYIEKMLKAGQAYYCYCTEEELAAARRDAERMKLPPRYNNRCRTLSEEERKKRETQGVRPVIRFKIETPELVVEDIIHGSLNFNLDQMVGDFVIVRQDGIPTFHLAVCVDDGLMDITHVIRGGDHLSNTPRHVLLFRALGFRVPAFAHISLLASAGGGLLSKRDGATSIREYREMGYPASGVVNYLSLLGWSSGEEEEIFSMEELTRRYDLSHMKKAPSIFDRTKLEWVSGMHLRRLSDEAFTDEAFAYLNARGLVKPGTIEKNPAWYREAALLFKESIHHYSSLGEGLKIFEDPLMFSEPAHLKEEKARAVISGAADALEGLAGAGDDFWPAWIDAIKKKVPAKGKDLFHPLRLALTGRMDGPELKRVVHLLGRARTLARLRSALEQK